MTPSQDTVEKIGRYEIVRKIATGGMAELFLGKFKGPGGFEKRCAIKRILPQFAADQTFQKMFQNEARVSAMFDHPNVVQVFELGQDEQGQFFIAMELVNGMNLRQLMQLARDAGQTIPPELAGFMMAQALDGLAYAHGFRDPETGEALNLVHRDISPQNILVSYEGAVKLVDFGIVKGSSISGETQAGMLKGKVAYMSPEQASGEPLDARSDLFSVGICFYELISSHRPFQGTNDIMTLKAILDDPPTPLTHHVPHIAEGIEHTIYRALEKFADQRYVSARAFHIELEQVLRDCPAPLGRHVVSDYIRSLTEGNTVSFDAHRLHIPRGLHGATPAGFGLGGAPAAGSGSYPGLATPGHPSSHPGYAPQAPQPWTQSQGSGTPTPHPSNSGVDYGNPPPPSSSQPGQRTPLPLNENIGGTSEMLRQAGLSAPRAKSPRWALFALSALIGAAAVAVFLHQQEPVVLAEPAGQSGRLVELAQRPPATIKAPPVSDAPTRVDEPRIDKPPKRARRPKRRRTSRRASIAKKPVEKTPVEETVVKPLVPHVATGELSVRSLPKGLSVTEKNKFLGKTPLDIRLPVGMHHLKLSSRSFGIQRKLTVEISKTGITSKHVQFATGTLKIVTRPWAEVYVNGKHMGKTPLTVPAYEGTQKVRLVTEDGQEKVQTQHIRAGQETLLRVKF